MRVAQDPAADRTDRMTDFILNGRVPSNLGAADRLAVEATPAGQLTFTGIPNGNIPPHDHWAYTIRAYHYIGLAPDGLSFTFDGTNYFASVGYDLLAETAYPTVDPTAPPPGATFGEPVTVDIATQLAATSGPVAVGITWETWNMSGGVTGAAYGDLGNVLVYAEAVAIGPPMWRDPYGLKHASRQQTLAWG